MAEVTHVPIGQVKRDISKLVNRVAYGDERVILTSRGKPKAAIVSMEDFERILTTKESRIAEWEALFEECAALGDEILERRNGVPLDIEADWELAREELEERDASRN